MLCSLKGFHLQLPDPRLLQGLHVSSLRWSIGQFNDAWLSALGSQNLPLETLKLDFCDQFSGAGLATLQTLKTLTVRTCENFTDATGVVGRLPLLTDLDLLDLDRLSLAGIKALRWASSLRNLSLRGCKQVYSLVVFCCVPLEFILDHCGCRHRHGYQTIDEFHGIFSDRIFS